MRSLSALVMSSFLEVFPSENNGLRDKNLTLRNNIAIACIGNSDAAANLLLSVHSSLQRQRACFFARLS